MMLLDTISTVSRQASFSYEKLSLIKEDPNKTVDFIKPANWLIISVIRFLFAIWGVYLAQEELLKTKLCDTETMRKTIMASAIIDFITWIVSFTCTMISFIRECVLNKEGNQFFSRTATLLCFCDTFHFATLVTNFCLCISVASFASTCKKSTWSKDTIPYSSLFITYTLLFVICKLLGIIWRRIKKHYQEKDDEYIWAAQIDD
ncbi:hypothetical protein AKO1_015465 [Acrasis kona]|uniref:Uncharacterized protein n=1 Tax=Acrasis kona TaxID=1008807 RepID=A0AAW2ZFT1_9EUKA